MSKHSPGPWVLRERQQGDPSGTGEEWTLVWIEAEGRVIAHMDTDRDNHEADACLMGLPRICWWP